MIKLDVSHHTKHEGSGALKINRNFLSIDETTPLGLFFATPNLVRITIDDINGDKWVYSRAVEPRPQHNWDQG